MTLYERLLHQGRRLFTSRSVMPLLLLPFLGLALRESSDVETAIGTTASSIVQWISLLIALCGLLVRCMTVAFAADGTSARDTRALRASGLNTTGMYSVVRHPLYLGAGLMWLGVAMSLRVWWLVIIVGFAYWVYIERVAMAEEAFLLDRFPDQFRQWVARTPAFIPRWAGWQRSIHPFQAKRLLSEHNGLLAVTMLFVLLQYFEDLQRGGHTWASWYSDHRDLVFLAEFAMVVSVICILVRRSPWMRGDATEPATQPATVEANAER